MAKSYFDDLDPEMVQEIVARIGKAVNEEVENRFKGASVGDVAERFTLEFLRWIIPGEIEVQPGRCPPGFDFSGRGDFDDVNPRVTGSERVGDDLEQE